jgi:hypothetical protein
MMKCEFCNSPARDAARYCRDCGASFGDAHMTKSAKTQADGSVKAKPNKALLLLVAASISALIIVLSLSPDLGGKSEDRVRACSLFSDGFKVAMSEDGSPYGMRVWRLAAGEAAQYARGQLAYELQSFADGTSDRDLVANVAELCG